MKKKLTHEKFVEKLSLVNNEIFPIDKYIDSKTKIRFCCREDHIWSSTPNIVLSGSGCPYCSGNMIWVGFNDLWTTRPDVAGILKNPEDGYKYTKGSGKKVDFICQQCGESVVKKISDVCHQGFSCLICSDGVSYPNKFIRQILQQLQIDFIPEYSPDWIKPMRYDCYFEYNGNKYIVEMDGRQHFYDNAFSGEMLNKIQANDQIKTSLAIQNGIQIIHIECIKSDCDYIKNNILSSELNGILNLHNIDWNLCDIVSQKSLVKETCDLYSSGITNLKDICNMLHICICTVRKYLKLGSQHGWCCYDAKMSTIQLYKNASTPVVIVDDAENVLYSFCSLRDCVKQIKTNFNITVNKGSIVNSCKTNKSYKGFNFRFANTTVQN